jgi:hypothetical protein
MSASAITNIYESLADLEISLTDGTTPYVYGLDELPESITTAILPCRLLLPVSSEPGDGRDGTHIAIGTAMSIIWQITDFMIWQPSEQGLGMREFAPKLIDYCGKYLDAMRAWGKCPHQNSTLEGVGITPGEYEWPRGSGKLYSGVICRLQIREVVSG